VPESVFARPGAGARLDWSSTGAAELALATLPDVPDAIRGCVSGRELIERGYAADVALAVEINSSRAVPVLRGGAFEPA
jgi:phosphosulfolactate phosphohydrolase-like enzyme